MPDYQYSTEPVCPHCGADVRDSWELFKGMEETVEHECGSCEKPFSITREVTFHYSAKGATYHG